MAVFLSFVVMKRGLLVFLLLVMCAAAAAEETRKGSVNLLALAENASGKHGIVASLSLEIRPGSERVFLETFPLTKLTTQASLRFAQQVACNELDVDCSEYDFFWTIHALPGIVGGPSAGSSAAYLTAALLLDEDVSDGVAATGTINSGGFVGPVGGMEHKVRAASREGLDVVFLPKGTKNVSVDNVSMSLGFFGKMLNVTVIETYELREMLNYSFGVPLQNIAREVVLDQRYQRVMRDVGEELCARTDYFLGLVNASEVPAAMNFSSRGEETLRNGSSYAAASFCFRANVELKQELYDEQNLSVGETHEKFVALRNSIEQTEQELANRSITTLTDLQTYMAVMERVEEAGRFSENDSVDELAYAEERFFSALAWSRFFDGQSSAINVSVPALRNSCISKLSEAEERINYIASVIAGRLDRTMDELQRARAHLQQEEFMMCLLRAAKAKSEANVVLSLMGVSEQDFGEVIDLKLRLANNAVVKSLDKGVFPIIAYSYLEYANSLRPLDRVSALLFAEYALELSNLEIYFPKERRAEKPQLTTVSAAALSGLAFGIIFGALLTWIVFEKTLQTPRRRLRGKKR